MHGPGNAQGAAAYGEPDDERKRRLHGRLRPLPDKGQHPAQALCPQDTRVSLDAAFERANAGERRPSHKAPWTAPIDAIAAAKLVAEQEQIQLVNPSRHLEQKQLGAERKRIRTHRDQLCNRQRRRPAMKRDARGRARSHALEVENAERVVSRKAQNVGAVAHPLRREQIAIRAKKGPRRGPRDIESTRAKDKRSRMFTEYDFHGGIIATAGVKGSPLAEVVRKKNQGTPTAQSLNAKWPKMTT